MAPRQLKKPLKDPRPRRIELLKGPQNNNSPPRREVIDLPFRPVVSSKFTQDKIELVARLDENAKLSDRNTETLLPMPKLTFKKSSLQNRKRRRNFAN